MLKSIKIIGMQCDEHGLKTLRDLWFDHLSYDPYWHFLWEGTYALIRCTEKNAESVVMEAESRGYKCVVELYMDNIPITRKYQGMFEKLFHAMSLLAVFMQDDEFDDITDRVLHCWLNMTRTPEREKRFTEFCGSETESQVMMEPMNMMLHAFRRAFTIGAIIHGNALRRAKQEKENEE